MTAAAYAIAAAQVFAKSSWTTRDQVPISGQRLWPWEVDGFRAGPARRMLVKAMTLLLAEASRVERIIDQEIDEAIQGTRDAS
ncbi:hypothetical protein K8I85_04610 [bacterium]|nr:hypothetical protein [bacterium]